MIDGLARRIGRARLNWACRGVLATPPLRQRAAALRVVSMVSSRDVLAYLVAVKSLYRHLPGGEIVVIDDGTLGAGNRAVIEQQLGHVLFVDCRSIVTAPCPRGGTWERLLHILDLSQDSYVIQMDSDVLTLGPVPEVVAAVTANLAFTLTSEARFGIVTLEEASSYVAGADPAQLQFRAEQVLSDLPLGLGRRYVRGSSGFTGFPRGGATRDAAERFSAEMERRLGARWTEWGTEQVASNYLLANMPGGHVLPWARYRCFYGDPLPEGTALAHFIGTWRYRGGVYVDQARNVIAALATEAGTWSRTV